MFAEEEEGGILFQLLKLGLQQPFLFCKSVEILTSCASRAVLLKGGYRKILFSFIGHVGQNIWREKPRNGLFGPKSDLRYPHVLAQKARARWQVFVTNQGDEAKPVVGSEDRIEEEVKGEDNSYCKNSTYALCGQHFEKNCWQVHLRDLKILNCFDNSPPKYDQILLSFTE